MNSESFSTPLLSDASLVSPSPSSATSNNELEIARIFRETVIEIAEVDPGTYHSQANFKQDLGLDSLDMVELVMICEKDFKVSMPDHEWTHLSYPGEMLKLIQQKCCHRSR